MPPPPPPLVLKAEPQLRRMPPKPSSAVVAPIARPPVKLVKAESGTKDDGSVAPSSKTEIPTHVAGKRAVITPSRAKPTKHLKVDETQHTEHDEVSEASTVPGELEVAPTQVDSATQETPEVEQPCSKDKHAVSPKTTLEPTPQVAAPVPTPAQPTPQVAPPVPKTTMPPPPVPPQKIVNAAQPKDAPQPKQVQQPKQAPQPKQVAASVRPQQQADVDQQFQVQNNDGTAIQPATPKERQQHYAAFKRQVTGEISSITVPHEFCAAWQHAVESKSRTAKNKLFSMWCSAGGSWSKIFGLNYQKNP